MYSDIFSNVEAKDRGTQRSLRHSELFYTVLIWFAFRGQLIDATI